MDKPFQRKGSESNAHVGRDFEGKIRDYFAKQGVLLNFGITVPIGINGKKSHSFDLGSNDKKTLVECKAHRWTEGGNVPSAKLTVWNEAMFFFYASPPRLPQASGGIARFQCKKECNPWRVLCSYILTSYPG